MGKLFNQAEQGAVRQKLRNAMPEAEVILWSKLKGKNISGFKFRRQHGVGKYVLDFFCPKARLAVEVDGDTHFRGKGPQKDRERERFIQLKGIKIVRFTNHDVYDNLAGVMRTIQNALSNEKEK